MLPNMMATFKRVNLLVSGKKPPNLPNIRRQHIHTLSSN